MCLLCPTGLPNGEGLLCCYRCRDGLRDALDADNRGDFELTPPLAPSIPVLAELVTVHKTRGGDGGRRAPGFEGSVPINLHAAAMLDPRSTPTGKAWVGHDGRVHSESETPPQHPATVLAGWVRLIAEERFAELPLKQQKIARLKRASWHQLGSSVVELADYLYRHVDWCCAQPWLDEYASAIRELHSQLRTVTRVFTGEHRPAVIGRCNMITNPEAPLEEQEWCGEPLYTPRSGDTITCRRCGAYWRRRDWLVLGREMENAS
ncbi:hypothetical protein LQ327_08865 [Actinomycetospora endophytica]|uniref:Uncharacterized protein n=1 Tax=Actinomycetospora endophytica TaxID=2291215 RepID=A0ABS8P6D9_9PSEU|nr:hypothetical protein [Actinomycetospora endophytica]MCD2193492.1 hypothetical protein [Actinomycetospora endophytica]